MKSPELFTLFKGFKPTEGGPKGGTFDIARRHQKMVEMVELLGTTKRLCLGLQWFRSWLLEQIEAPDLDPFEIGIYKTVLEKFDNLPEFQGKKE